MSTLLPFLYQTRTLRRLPRAGISRSAYLALSHSATRDDRNAPRGSHRGQTTGRNAIPFDLPPHLQSLGPDTKPGPSTITPHEREAFDRIFKEIAARKRSTASVSQDVIAASPAPREAAAQQSNKTKPTDAPPSAVDRTEALSRFPPSLRKGARLALGIPEPSSDLYKTPRGTEGTNPTSAARQSDTESDTNPGTSVETGDNEISQRKEHSRRVLDQMRTARSDFELWDVLESDVFSMVKQLGIGEDINTKDAEPSTLDEGAERLSMKIHGPLYPFYLITGLRLMDRGFARASPLALDILPRVKELGTLSHVLGATTEFYNTLAEIYWHRNGNPGAVFDLLEEMRQTGLYYDRATYILVQRIGETLNKGAKGALGPFLQEVMALPEYEFEVQLRAQRWSATISKQIHQQI